MDNDLSILDEKTRKQIEEIWSIQRAISLAQKETHQIVKETTESIKDTDRVVKELGREIDRVNRQMGEWGTNGAVLLKVWPILRW